MIVEKVIVGTKGDVEVPHVEVEERQFHLVQIVGHAIGLTTHLIKGKIVIEEGIREGRLQETHRV